jgi:microcystin-dependent protein
MDFYIGVILPLAFDYAPEYTANCDGTLLPISTNAAMYSLLGVVWGGDPTLNFNLPDLRGRIPVGCNAASMGNYNQRIGVMNSTTKLGINAAGYVQLNSANMPLHTHQTAFAGTAATITPTVSVNVQVSGTKATQSDPRGNMIAFSTDPNAGGDDLTYIPAASSTDSGNLAGVNVATTGSNYTPQGAVQIGASGNPTPSPINVMPPLGFVRYVIVNCGIYPVKP